MQVNRRSLLALLGASFVGEGFFAGNANAQTTVTVRGQVESAVGTSVDGSYVEVVSPNAGVFEPVPIEDGVFETTLEGDNRYMLTFWHQILGGDYKTGIDGIPMLFDLEQDVQIENEDIDLGTYQIPEGHEVQVRFEDTNGNPVEGLFIGLRTSDGSGTDPQSLFTNADGYVYYDNDNVPGVELVGDINIEVRSPKDHNNSITPRRLSVNEPQDVTVELQNPGNWGGKVVKSDPTTDSSETDNTESDPTTDDLVAGNTEGEEDPGNEEHRGFITNDPDSSLAFLDNPVTLTWGGMAISILGITFQLLGRN